MKFSPIADFEAPEFGSTYLKGFNYTVQPDNHKLMEAVQEWLKAGKIREVIPTPGIKASPSSVSGRGKIT